MTRQFLTLSLVALLAACGDGNPFDASEDGEPTIDPVENTTLTEVDANNLSDVQYDADAGTLSVDMRALDAVTDDYPLAEYIRNTEIENLVPELTGSGYQVYSYQDDAADRMFVAIVATTPDGSATGAVVMDGLLFNTIHAGTYFEATDFTPGTAATNTGLVSYAGNYAAMANLPADGDQLIQGELDTSLQPDQPTMIEGKIYLNADFGDNAVEGAIYDRSFVNLSPAFETIIEDDSLDDVILVRTAITGAGDFLGDVENDEDVILGQYEGAFGGTNAPGSAGNVHLNGDWLPVTENEEEFGVFVLVQCGQAGNDALCGNVPVNPN